MRPSRQQAPARAPGVASRRVRSWSVAAVVVAASATASAQPVDQPDPVPSLDLRGFRPSTDPASGIYLEPAASPGTFEWNVALWVSYVYRPITLRDPSTDEIVFDVIEHQLSSDLTANVGFGKRAALGVDLPLIVDQRGQGPTPDAEATLGPTALPSQALGDLGLVGKLTLVRPTGGEFGGFALALHDRFTIPTGDDASFLGEGAVTNEARILGEYRLVAASLHLAAGVKVRGDGGESFACQGLSEDDCDTRFGHELPFGLGLSLRPQAFGIDEQGHMTWLLETRGHVPIYPEAPFSSGTERISSANVALGMRYGIRDASILVGAETAILGGAVGSSPFRGFVQLAWAPREHDIDRDGVEDELDQCRELPEDRDLFQDDDGCPEGDNDDDGVPDGDDRCAAEKEDEDGFKDDDGCVDPDNDADGILDVADECPDESGPTREQEGRNGCPVKDTDADGIEGEEDKCPDAAEDKDEFEDGDGCPDPDNDLDGIADHEDACPVVKGVALPGTKDNGCVDPDPDNDTFLGADDKCPDKAETWNGRTDADGCPEEGKGAAPFAFKDKKGSPTIEMATAVKHTAAGEVDPASLPALRALGAALRKHPSYRVAVGVRPSAKLGEDEAKKRAGAVVDALRGFARRDSAADVAPWDDVKDAAGANAHGIGFVLRTGASPTP